MASEKFNTLSGITVGIPPIDVVDQAGNIVSNFNNLSGNVSANRVFANSYFYANGQPFTGASGNGAVGGSDGTIQFNNDGNFAGVTQLSYNPITGTLSAPNVQISGMLSVPNISNLSIQGGSNNQVIGTDGNGNLRWQAGTGAAGNPGGANSYVQFNNSGSFGGNPAFTFDNTTNTLMIETIQSQDVNTVSVDANSISGLSINTTDINISNNTTISGNLRVTGNVNFTGSGTVNLGIVNNLRVSGGSNGQVLTTDGNGNVTWQTAGGSGTGSPGGANTQIQFNAAGLFSGSPSFTFNNSTQTVQVSGNLIANTFQMGSGVYRFSNSEVFFAETNSTTINQVIYSIPIANISGVEFHIIATNQGGNARQSSKISSVVLGELIEFTEYASLELRGGVGEFDVDYNPGNIMAPPSLELKVSPIYASQTVFKMLVTVFSV